MFSRRIRTTAAALGLLVLASGLAQPAGAVPARARGADLPTRYLVSHDPGVHPEGVAVHHDGTMYVSSDGTGALYRGDVAEDRLSLLDAAGATDRGRTDGIHTSDDGRIWSVGAARLTVHDRDGRLLASRDAAGGPLAPAFLNDLVLTPTAVYVTDWHNPVVYRAEVNGTVIGPLEPWLDIGPAATWFPAQYWFLNGIVADPSGSVLLVGSNGTEALWRIDTQTRAVEQVDVGAPSFGPDGMAVRGDTLYAVLNYGAPSGVYIADLAKDWRSAEVRAVVQQDADGVPFDVPTTIALHDCRLYVVNSQLNDPEAAPPFTVSAVADPTC